MRLPEWRRMPKGWVLGIAALAGVSGTCYSFMSYRTKEKYEPQDDLTGKTYVVIGATSGIGKETARELAKRKARVIMACRNSRKCIEIRRSFVIGTKNMDIYCRKLDLADADSIVDFAAKLCKGKNSVDRIDGIIFNAATVETRRLTNAENVERMLATNHLGPFLLTALLFDQLSRQSNPVRLIYLNSSMINRYDIDLNDLNSTNVLKWKKSPEAAKKETFYRSKLALALFTKTLAGKIEGTNMQAMMVDPGLTKTDLFYRLEASEKKFFLTRWYKNTKRWLYGLVAAQSVYKAVPAILYAATDKNIEDANGIFINGARAHLSWPSKALNRNVCEELWLISGKWTNARVQMEKFYDEINSEANSKTGKKPENTENYSRAKDSGCWWTLWLW